MTHELKCWPECFEAVKDGRKRFEVRYADRPFAVGDLLVLIEHQPEPARRWGLSGHSTGRRIQAIVTYLMRGGQFGVAQDFVVLGLGEPVVIP